MTDEAPTGHVVHLVVALDDPVPPAQIGFGKRLSPLARGIAAGFIAIGTIAALGLLVALWSDGAPWWVTLLSPLLPILFLGACVFAVAESYRLSRREAVLAARWAQTRERASATFGRVTDRTVSLTDHGGVSSFTLLVTTEAGSAVRACWFRSNPVNQDATLLQPQVPALGSPVRIWSVGEPDADAPVIVEALDPSRVG